MTTFVQLVQSWVPSDVAFHAAFDRSVVLLSMLVKWLMATAVLSLLCVDGVSPLGMRIPSHIVTNGCTAPAAPCMTFSVENVVVPVKTNQNGQGTCSAQNLADPVTGLNDSIKDLKCQFATSGLPTGTHFGVVSGYFVDPLDIDVVTGKPAVKAFSARQEVTILP